MLLLKAAGIWLLILVCAILNGAFRESVLLPNLAKPVALALSGLLLCLCIVVISLIFVHRLGRLGTSHSLFIGLFWLCLTLAFEFGFGRVFQHRTWPQLLDAYTFKGGNLWPLILVVTFLAPLLTVRLSARAQQGSQSGA